MIKFLLNIFIQGKIKKVMCSILLIFLFAFMFFPPPIVNSEKIGILLVIGQDEISKSDNTEKVKEWKTKQGFEVWTVTADQFDHSAILKEYLRNFYSANPNLKYVVLPPQSFFGKIKYKLSKIEYESFSDKYFENLDDDPLFQPEILVGRATIQELVDISNRQNIKEVVGNIAFPIFNFDRWACVPGECLAYTSCDPSYLGEDIKKLFSRNKLKAYTFFEQEGIKRSRNKPDFPLTEENIKVQLEQSNLIWYLNTLEPLMPQPEGYTMYSTYSDFYRAIWTKDDNEDHFITDSELAIKPFFQFSEEKTTINRIGFLPLFANDKMNLNQFSSIIGIQAMDGAMFVPDVGDGLTPSVLAMYRIVMENLIRGRSVGESIQVFKPYREKFSHDIYNQEYLALGFFVRGDPSLSVSDLVEKAVLTLLPEEVEITSHLVIPIHKTETEFTIKNSGSGLLPFSIEYDDKIFTISPSSGVLEAGSEQIIKVSIKSPSLYRQYLRKNSSPKKKRASITIKTNPRNKTLQVIWFSS